MTNTPGWAPPGSAEPPEPDDGDSAAPAPTASDADAVESPAATEDAAADEAVRADETATLQADETEAEADAPARPPATGPAPQQPASAAWSPQQPPAGQWHTPSTTEAPAPAPVPPAPQAPGPGHPTSGWGNQSAPPAPPQDGGPRWGPATGQYAGWQPGHAYPVTAPAPKPGMVPLRPLDAGEILSGAFTSVRKHWRTALLLIFGVALLTETAGAAINAFFVDDDRLDDLSNNPDPRMSDILHVLGGTAGATALVTVIGIMGTVLGSGLFTAVISRSVLGRTADFRSVWREIRPRFPQLLGLAFLLPLGLAAFVALLALPGLLIALAGATAAGAALGILGALVGCIVYIWRWNLWSLTAPALMLERQSIKAAMKRSTKLVSGAWWRVFGVQLLVTLVTGMASFVIQLPFVVIAATTNGDGLNSLFAADSDAGWTAIIISTVGGVIASTLALPTSAGAVSLLYIDQRIRREALDVELARAANVPGHDASSSATPAGSHL